MYWQSQVSIGDRSETINIDDDPEWEIVEEKNELMLEEGFPTKKLLLIISISLCGILLFILFILAIAVPAIIINVNATTTVSSTTSSSTTTAE